MLVWLVARFGGEGSEKDAWRLETVLCSGVGSMVVAMQCYGQISRHAQGDRVGVFR